MIQANNAIQGSINQNAFTVTTSNFTGTIPSNKQNLYGTILLLKKYDISDYEYIPLGSIDLDESNIDDAGYTARFNIHSYNFSSDKAFGFLGFAIPSVTRVIAALTQAVYLSNRVDNEYYIYDDKLWKLLYNNINDVFPNETSGNWILINELSSFDLLNLLRNKLSSQYDYYYDNYMLIAPCRVETWTHSQACVNGKVTLSGISNLGNTYGPITTVWNCDSETYTYTASCVGGFIKITRTGDVSGSIEEFFTQYPCDPEYQTEHDYYSEIVCAENCKPTTFVVEIYDRLSTTPTVPVARFETDEVCCGCEETPTSEIVCDEESGMLRVNMAETSCSGAYSLLTNIPCPTSTSCPGILKLTKNACDNFTIKHDMTSRTYYIKVVPYETPYTETQISQMTIFLPTNPYINQMHQEHVLDMSSYDDGMYLVYLIYTESIDGEPVGKALIMPLYKTCAMEECMDKLIKSILCMCDCPDGNDCDPEFEAQYRYELNKLFSILAPVQQLMMLRLAMDGQVLNFDTDLLQKYYDLGLMIKKMNLMIDRCGLCNEEIEDCGCNG